MKISVYTMAVETFVPTLESLATVLDKGAVHAQQAGLDLVNARLAPDMYTLAQQVQLACYQAKDATARLSGAKPAAMEDAGKSFPDLKLAIARTISFINGVPVAAFEGAEERDCTVEPPNTDFVIALNGLTLLRSWSLPHFYFHVVTAYDILRHHGVAIGKRDYASWVGAFIRPKAT